MSDSSISLPLDLERDRKAAKKLLKRLQSADAAEARAAAERFVASHPAFRHLDPSAVRDAKPTLRDAQLTIAREYGFDDWSAWKTHVALSNGDARALIETGKRLIKAQDGEGLQSLLNVATRRAGIDAADLATELFPRTLSWVNFAGDNEAYETRVPCDRILLDAGARVGDCYLRSVATAATAQVRLLHSRGKLPINLRTVAVLGDRQRVRACFDERGQLRPEARPARDVAQTAYEGLGWPDPADTARVIGDALRFGARHAHREVVVFLWERALGVEPGIAERVALAPAAVADFLCTHRRELNVEDCLLSWEFVHQLRLDLAAAAGDVAEFERLLDRAPEFLGATHLSYQVRTLEVAAFSDRAPIAKVLLERSEVLRDVADRLGRALQWAVEYGNREMVELLSPLCAPPDDLATAAGLGSLDRVKALLDERGTFSRFARPGAEEGADAYSPLMRALGLACMNGEFEVAEFLLAHGADVNGTWSTHQPATVLHEMAGTGRLEAARFLIENGADPTIRDGGYGAFAHGWAAVFGHPEVRDYLLEHAAARNLFAAIDLGRPDKVERLLDDGCDIDEQVEAGISRGDTPLFLAVSQDKLEIVELLLARGADLSLRTPDNRNAMHFVDLRGDCAIPITRALLAAGVDPRAAGNDGRNGIERARAEGREDLASLMEGAAE